MREEFLQSHGSNVEGLVLTLFRLPVMGTSWEDGHYSFLLEMLAASLYLVEPSSDTVVVI